MKEKQHNHNEKDAGKPETAGPAHNHAEPLQQDSEQGGHAKEHKPHVHSQGHAASTHGHEPGKPVAPADAEKLKAAREELAALKDRMLRLQADFDNMRKRVLKERTEIYARANEDIMLELLPVLDHLEIAIAAAGKQESGAEHAAVIDGFRLVSEQLVSALKKFGMEAINAEGQPFDTNMHEAIAQMPSETEPEGTVINQTRHGWMLGGRLLRPVQVVVSMGKAEIGERKEEAEGGGEAISDRGQGPEE